MSDAKEPQEDRAFRSVSRVRARLKVRLAPVAGQAGAAAPAKEEQTTTRDVSEGGAFLRTAEAHEAGTLLRLSVDLGDGQDPVEAEAEVLRAVEASADGSAGVAVKFVALEAADRIRLQNIRPDDDSAVFELWDELDDE